MVKHIDISMKKPTLTFVLLIVSTLFAMAQQQDTARTEVLMQTSMGDIRMQLYNETPCHRDNFLKLVREGYYDGTLFHRVISNFMVQAGDSTTRHAVPGKRIGGYSPNYTVPAEIVYPKFFHKRGALAAAREADEDNPLRASSSAQFYIVWGNTYSSMQLDFYQAQISKATNESIEMTPEIREYYKKYGGTPHLDGQYTVFGEVTEGLDVVEKIQKAMVDDYARPVDDIRIIKVVIDEK